MMFFFHEFLELRWDFIFKLYHCTLSPLWCLLSLLFALNSSWIDHFVMLTNSSNVHNQTFLWIFQPFSSIPVAMETVSTDQEVSVLQSRNFSRSVEYHMADIIIKKIKISLSLDLMKSNWHGLWDKRFQSSYMSMNITLFHNNHYITI